jgi:hypothetical protein
VSAFFDTASNFTVNVEPEVNVWVRSLPLTEMPSDEDEDVTDPAVCCADAQLKLPIGKLVGVLGGEVTGVVPPPDEFPPLAAEVVGELEALEVLEVEVPSDEPPEHPAIIRAAAIAVIDVIRIVIGSAACRNKPLVRVGC